MRIRCFLALAGLLISAGQASGAQVVGLYADWTIEQDATGSGTLQGSYGMPDFTYSIGGDYSGDNYGRQVVYTTDPFDCAPWESLFGEGSHRESLRFGSYSTTGTMAVASLTLRFQQAVAPSVRWAFAVTDLESEDAVIEASLDGEPIPVETVAGWFQGLFDSKPGTSRNNLPSAFDTARAAVVAEFDPDGILSDETSGYYRSESASAWFMPDTPLDTLTIHHRNRFGGGASMHVYLAAVPEPSTMCMLGIGTLGLLLSRRKRSA